MSRPTLTGSRIRAKRLELGLKQAKLAQDVGISPAYLNLIEHNKRRIGGKLLLDLARALHVDATALSEGVEATLLATLRDAASQGGDAEISRMDEFAGRFPGWAGVLASQHDRIAALEHTIATLTDRLTHDPFLSASLHEVLSTAAAIRSTASILAGGNDVEAEWQARFQRNLLEDAKRLADGAGELVSYLDGAGDVESAISSPLDELEAYLEKRGYHLPELEAGEEVSAAAPFASYLQLYRDDADRLPLVSLQKAVAEGLDPAGISARFGIEISVVLRRMACLPLEDGQAPVGLVRCDGSGTLTFRKPVAGFSLPRFGAACPLWPLYQSLLRPQVPIRTMVDLVGRDGARFLTYAIAQPRVPAGFDGVQVVEATMLIIPQSRVESGQGSEQPIGVSCRICSRQACVARREASILADEEDRAG